MSNAHFDPTSQYKIVVAVLCIICLINLCGCCRKKPMHGLPPEESVNK